MLSDALCRTGADGKHELSYLPWHHGTPLIGAAAAGHADVCKALLAKGAKKDAGEQVGRACACIHPVLHAVFCMLRARGCALLHTRIAMPAFWCIQSPRH